MSVPEIRSCDDIAPRVLHAARGASQRTARFRYRAAQHDCDACMLKPKCCPNMPARKIARSVHEAARDKARAIAKTEAYAVSCRERKKVEMLFAHLKRILRLGRLRLRGLNGAKDEFLLAGLIAYPLAVCFRCRGPFVAGAEWQEASNGEARARFHRACHIEWRSEQEAAARRALGLAG